MKCVHFSGVTALCSEKSKNKESRGSMKTLETSFCSNMLGSVMFLNIHVSIIEQETFYKTV